MRRKGEDTDAVEEIPAASAAPVVLPDLPPTLVINTVEQYKALADPVRKRILGILQHHPATAKQLADWLGMAPGTAGHQLRVLEAAGLVQVVARRVVNGIIAKYYARTARIFLAEFSPEITGVSSTFLNRVQSLRDELAETLAKTEGATVDESTAWMEVFRVRLSPERARVYQERLTALIEDLAREVPDPAGVVYTVGATIFRAPPYLQREAAPPDE